jgi:hypothetical protein
LENIYYIESKYYTSIFYTNAVLSIKNNVNGKTRMVAHTISYDASKTSKMSEIILYNGSAEYESTVFGSFCVNDSL